MATRSYLIPRFGAAQAELSGFLREAVQEGEAWLGSQKPASEYQSVLERLTQTSDNNLVGQSNARYPKTERVAREIVASLTSFSHVGEYKPVSKQELYPQAGILTKLDRAWWHQELTGEALRSIVQYAVALGTGYGWQQWDPHFYGMYKGDIRLQALGPDCVTFVQMPKDHDVQRSYMVLIREELPINLARRIYGRTNRAFADALTPDRDAPGWVSRGLRKVQQFLSPALRVRGMKPGEHDSDASFPTVDIFHAYTLDDTINESGQPMMMGAPGTNWEYQVPSLNGEIQTDLINPRTGNPWTRPADAADAQLFPLRRYTIFARTTDIVCYDGSSPWWHGQVPITRFAFNKWAWDALGRSCVGMLPALEDSASAIMQGMEDSIAARLDPPMVYNDQAVSRNFAEAFNPRKAGARAAVDFNAGDVIKFPVPPEFYNVPQFVPNYLEWLDDRMEYLSGARDLTAISKAKQLPSSDGLEKLLEMAGPLVQDMVRGLILPLQQMGTMRKSDYFQFYTYTRILTETDSDGDESDWTYRPEILVPRLNASEEHKLWRTRAQKLVEEFKYRVSQSGISEINRMTVKLFYIQLMKAGFPIDWWTFAKVAQIPRFGAEPAGTDSVLERWIAQQHMTTELQHELMGPPEAGDGGGGPPASGPARGGPGQPPVNKGRPQSFQRPPKLVSKDGGARSTITTS